MPLPLSDADAAVLMKQFRENNATKIAYNVSDDQVIYTDVFIASSSPITYVPCSSLILCLIPNHC